MGCSPAGFTPTLVAQGVEQSTTVLGNWGSGPWPGAWQAWLLAEDWRHRAVIEADAAPGPARRRRAA